MSEAAEKLVIACPTCGKRYRAGREHAGKKVRCSCGTVMVVPASQPGPRFPSPSPQIPAPSTPVRSTAARPAATQARCAHHPDAPAVSACARCHTLICGRCDHPQPDGSHLCPTCAPRASAPPTWRAYASPVSPRVGGTCPRHPEVAAVARCAGCSALVCATCDFKMPGGRHYCPDCATSTSQPMASWRKGLAAWSLVLAGWVTLMSFIVVSGALAEVADETVGGIIIIALIMAPGMLGLGFACGIYDSQAGNPPLVWVSIIWNGILLAAWVLLIVIAIMSQGGM